ncbi:MAG TPA: hypothetical protein VK699_00245 [Terriglobales bacterium]|nr:hypothetical protein [Terriglobales bacterium]
MPRKAWHGCEKDYFLIFLFLLLPHHLPAFFEWCYAYFTNSQSGTARLVIVPPEDRKGLNGTGFLMSHIRYTEPKP